MRASQPITGIDQKSGAKLGRVVIMPTDLFETLNAGKITANSRPLTVCKPVIENTDFVDFLAFNKQETESARVVADHMRADFMGRTTAVEDAIWHEQPVITETLKAAFLVPLVDRRKHLKRRHVGELPGINRGAMKNCLFDRNLSFALQDHVKPHENARRW